MNILFFQKSLDDFEEYLKVDGEIKYDRLNIGDKEISYSSNSIVKGIHLCKVRDIDTGGITNLSSLIDFGNNKPEFVKIISFLNHLEPTDESILVNHWDCDNIKDSLNTIVTEIPDISGNDLIDYQKIVYKLNIALRNQEITNWRFGYFGSQQVFDANKVDLIKEIEGQWDKVVSALGVQKVELDALKIGLNQLK